MNLQDQLLEILANLESLKVEFTLIIGAISLLIAGLITKSGQLLKSIYALTIVFAFYHNWQGFSLGLALSNSLFIASTAQNFTAIFLGAGLLILLYHREEEHATEFYFFILSILVGGIMLMKANSFLVAYLSIELTSFTAYIITNFSFKKVGFEAGIKYLLFGAVSTAIMLFGFGLVYGVSDIFFISELNEINKALPASVGLLLIVFGLLFKGSVVPFHIWVPATYQSAPNDATAILSIVPKLAAFVLLQRIFQSVGFDESWISTACLMLGMLTIVFGTLSALRQSNARRMISFGAIAHSGFLLPLVIMESSTSNEAFWWYAAAYALMNVAIFFFLDVYERKGVVQVSDYGGQSGTDWVLNSAMTIILISLVGLPPAAGFTAKFLLFGSLWEFYSNGADAIYITYLIVALFATVISLFFYLRIPYQMFLVKAETLDTQNTPVSTKIIATLFSIVLLLLFFAPQILTVMQQLLNSHIAYE